MANNTFQFGAGTLFIKPTGGTLPTNPTPIRLGTLQEMSGDVKRTDEMLYGQNQLPDDVAAGQIKITGKATWASMQGIYLLQSFLPGSVATGILETVDNESHSISVSTPYTVTVTNASTPIVDLGVVYAATGVQLTLVASAPTTGEYAVVPATGVYTFAAADEGLGVFISYQYTNSSGGNTYNFQNPRLGVAPTCSIYLYMPYNNAGRTIIFGNARIGSVTWPTKQKGYVIQSMDFTAYDVPGGNYMSLVGM